MKLKVGDKVRLTGKRWPDKDQGEYDYPARGSVVEVTDVGENGAYASGGRAGALTMSTGEMYEDYEFEVVEPEPEPEPEAVNHPAHYNADPSGIECIEVVRHRNFNIGNAIKYLWRAGLKDEDSEVQDLQKAIWYIQDEIERL